MDNTSSEAKMQIASKKFKSFFMEYDYPEDRQKAIHSFQEAICFIGSSEIEAGKRAELIAVQSWLLRIMQEIE